MPSILGIPASGFCGCSSTRLEAQYPLFHCLMRTLRFYGAMLFGRVRPPSAHSSAQADKNSLSTRQLISRSDAPVVPLSEKYWLYLAFLVQQLPFPRLRIDIDHRPHVDLCFHQNLDQKNACSTASRGMCTRVVPSCFFVNQFEMCQDFIHTTATILNYWHVTALAS